MRLLFLLGIISIIRGYKDTEVPPPSSAARGLRGGANAGVRVLYRYVYWGSVAEDIGLPDFPPMEPNSAVAVAIQADPFVVLNEMHQLPDNGGLPEPLTVPEAAGSFSAILRYNPKSAENVQRIENWIAANKDSCREIHVVNYPILNATPEDQIALNALCERFVNSDPQRRIKPVAVGFNQSGEAPTLMHLFPIFTRLTQPHALLPVTP